MCVWEGGEIQYIPYTVREWENKSKNGNAKERRKISRVYILSSLPISLSMGLPVSSSVHWTTRHYLVSECMKNEPLSLTLSLLFHNHVMDGVVYHHCRLKSSRETWIHIQAQDTRVTNSNARHERDVQWCNTHLPSLAIHNRRKGCCTLTNNDIKLEENAEVGRKKTLLAIRCKEKRENSLSISRLVSWDRES